MPGRVFSAKKLKSDKRGFLQIPFSWLFAIIIGAIIIFFAIYFAVKLIGTETTVSTAQIGSQINVLLNPLETSFGEEQVTALSIPVESLLSNNCDNAGNFGSQQIIVSQKAGGQWTDTNIAPTSHNKYIFSNTSVEGKNFYLFSKPLNLPFKIADLIYLTSANDNYCFISAPGSIQDELSNLKQGNIFIANCPSNSINVCFSQETNNQNCSITVDQNQKSVKKNGQTMYYETDALMYGAIFSNPDIYECQVQRLMKRTSELSVIYNEKQTVISGKGCSVDTSLSADLLNLEEAAKSVNSSSDLINVRAISDSAEQENSVSPCFLW